jgi:hypothetical protein
MSIQDDFRRQVEEHLRAIQNDCIKILNESIKDTVYSHINSQYGYERTNQLQDINNIKCKINNDGELTIYIDTDNMNYYTFGKGGSDTGRGSVDSSLVVHVLEVGHDVSGEYSRDSSSNYDYWDNYPAQHFLELAQQRIKSKYPDLSIEVLRGQPNVY